MTSLPEDRLSVTILGSGTCVPSLRRSACAVLVEAGSTSVLMDVGPGTMGRLLEARTEIFDITLICLSHFHLDHCGELPAFLFATRYPDAKRRQSPLILAGGRGLAEFVGGLKQVWGRWIEPPAGLTMMEFGDGGDHRRPFDDFVLDARPVVHNPESTAFRITVPNGRSVVYSGDTDVCDGLVALAQGADLLICESAFPDELRVSGHLTPSLAGEMARRARVKKLVLTHFYPQCDAVDMAAQCRKTWQGPLVLAEDLMRIAVE
ncbi:MAG: MBL fold metallo-hydrolase [Desulfobacterales bacterium]|nr:MBL fold metallo-hydrolase [Desulfobacterales bacterium]